MKRDMNPNAKLSMTERIGYGLGDFAANLIYASVTGFLLLYYSNVVGVDAGIAASIIAISKIFDGISDLIMGFVVDHTRSKYGKARPWILRLCIPLAVSTVMLFYVPPSLTGMQQLYYLFLTYNLVSTVFFTGVNVPYSAMNGLITRNPYERGLLGNFRMIFATAGSMTINTFVLKMAALFGNGDMWSQAGWTKTYVIIGIASVLLNLFTFRVCRERVSYQMNAEKTENMETTENTEIFKNTEAFENVEKAEHEKKADVDIPIGQALKGLFTNKYWVLMAAAMLLLYFMMSCFFGSAAFYVQYVMGDLNNFASISNAMSIAQIITMLCTPYVMRKVTKRKLMMAGGLIQAAGFAGAALAGSNLTMQIVLSVIKGIGFGCGAAAAGGLLQDAITYGQWKHKFGTMGIGNAASSFGMKVGSGLGTAVLGTVLDAGGFDPAVKVQSASALSAISLNFTWIPAIASAMIVICMVFFDLDKIYDQVVAELDGKGE